MPSILEVVPVDNFGTYIVANGIASPVVLEIFPLMPCEKTGRKGAKRKIAGKRNRKFIDDRLLNTVGKINDFLKKVDLDTTGELRIIAVKQSIVYKKK